MMNDDQNAGAGWDFDEVRDFSGSPDSRLTGSLKALKFR